MKRILMVGLLSVAVVLAFGRTHHVYAASVDAIAVDDDQDTKGGNAGFGTGEGDTAKEAQREALKNCRKSGNKSCEVALTYKQCGAYASSKKHAGTGMGATESAARKAALEIAATIPARSWSRTASASNANFPNENGGAARAAPLFFCDRLLR